MEEQNPLRLFFIISLIAISALSVGKSNAQEESVAGVEAPALRIIDIPNEEGIISIENETSYEGQTPTLATNQSSVLTDKLPNKELSSSKEVIDFLIEREGNASFVNPNHPSNDPFGLYNDPEGNCTVGIGHLLHSGACTEEDKANHTNEFPNGMKKNDALKLFEKDLSEVESQVKSVIKVPITQNQYDALVSFVYNEGINVFISSKLLKDVNEFNHDPKTIEDDFLQYTRNDWLTDRRIAEANMFNHGDYSE